MTQSELKELYTSCIDMARNAGEILRRGFRQAQRVQLKSRIDPVTQWDLKSEKYITSRIRETYLDHDILAEEGSERDSNSDFVWVIDPLDGTVNFSHGFPIYCTSIGLQYRGESVVGAVYSPETDEMFSGMKGKGAYLNGQKISVSTETKLDRALLATGFAYDIATAKRNNLGLFARMAKKAQGIRRPGSAALDLCWLACGRTDGFWELKLHPWDTAAAVCILAEAGGRVSRIDGSPFTIFDRDLLASNGHLHKKMQKVLSGS